jgi:uncharacterized protein (DUF1800 family)
MDTLFTKYSEPDEIDVCSEVQSDCSPDADFQKSKIARATGVGYFAIATSACGGGDSTPAISSLPPIMGGPSTSPASAAANFEANSSAARFLLRASFSASSASIEALRNEGPDAWLQRYMRQPNDRTAAQFFAQNGLDEVNEKREFMFDQRFDLMIWNQLFEGGNSVRKRFSLALSQFFVVSTNPTSRLDVVWPAQAVGAFWDILNEHAFGNFRDLLEAVTLSPAMGAFLNTLGNRKEDPASGRVADENYGREVMQLFSIGLLELNIDGSIRTTNGKPIETYTNEDVAGIAKVFTGYELDTASLDFTPDPGRKVDLIPAALAVRRPMTADPSRWTRPATESEHSLSEKRFLGSIIPAGTAAKQSLRMALDTLFNHSNVGPFFGKQMIQRLVTSNPSPNYVRRVAQTFNNNGSGVRGDLGAVFRAILLDEEALSPNGLNDMRFGKLREPVVRFVQFARTFGFSSGDLEGIFRDLSDSSRYIGQVPFRSPSVFNFFRPSFVPPGTVTAANNMLGPEFQLINEVSISGYLNFMERTIDGRGYWLNGIQPDYRRELEIAHDVEALLERLNLIITGGQLRESSRASIKAAMEDVTVIAGSDDGEKLRRIHIGVFLIMSSNDYLVQK